jgi:8-oxo-dGTP pyrophosphatase MutT (NUDIX family)
MVYAGSILPNVEHVNVVVRELLEENGVTLTFDDLTKARDQVNFVDVDSNNILQRRC